MEELENETNQEMMERWCGTPTLSSSFRSIGSKDFWSPGDDEEEHEDLLTLTTLTLQASHSPGSSFGGLLGRTITSNDHNEGYNNLYEEENISGSDDSYAHSYYFYRSTPV